MSDAELALEAQLARANALLSGAVECVKHPLEGDDVGWVDWCARATAHLANQPAAPARTEAELAQLRERVEKVKALYEALPAIPQYKHLKPFSTEVMATLEGWPPVTSDARVFCPQCGLDIPFDRSHVVAPHKRQAAELARRKGEAMLQPVKVYLAPAALELPPEQLRELVAEMNRPIDVIEPEPERCRACGFALSAGGCSVCRAL